MHPHDLCFILAGSLRVTDLTFVLSTLWAVRSKWYNIGIELGIAPEDLEAIKGRHHDNPVESFKEMLFRWLRRDYPKSSWIAMAAALRAKSVGFRELADEIVISDLIQFDGAFCCSCRHCSLRSYLDHGCPRSKPGSIPYLDITKLEKNDKEILFQKLDDACNEILNDFTELLNHTRTSLNEREVSVQDLTKCVLEVASARDPGSQKLLSSEDEKDLKNSKSIDEVFAILNNYTSAFNFALIEGIISNKKLCSNDDHNQLRKYRTKLITFYERKVFQISPVTVCSYTTLELEKCRQQKLVVLLTKHEKTITKEKIASLLDLKVSSFDLHNIIAEEKKIPQLQEQPNIQGGIFICV